MSQARPAPVMDPSGVLRPFRRVRQIRQFTTEPLTDDQVGAIVDVGRWSGSSRNSQPWRFIVIRDRATLARIGELGAPSTRALASATVAIVVVMPTAILHAGSAGFDDGRATERMLIAAQLLGLGSSICWVPPSARPDVSALLGVPDDRVVRTILALGHPAPEALAPKSPGAAARLPRSETVFAERWDAPE